MTRDQILWAYGRLPNDLVGFPNTQREVNQPPSAPNPTGPVLTFGAVPTFLMKYSKQVGVMLLPKTVFIADNSNPNWNAYTVSNHVARSPELVFQSPLDYIGIPQGSI